MTSNYPDKNNFFDNDIEGINNNNKNNNKKAQKSTSSDQFIFFKEEILKDIKQLESKITLKYDMQNNISSNKISKIESILEQINQRIEFLSSSITTDNSLKEKLEKVSNWNTKLDESLVLQDVRIKNVYTKLTETIDKYDNIIAESIIYPGVVGPKSKYKTFHELIDFFIFNINQLMIFKDKTNLDLKDYKYKTDSMISNFQVKLDYLTKNANAFTSSNIRTSEKKMEQIFNNQLGDFKNEFNEFKNEFNSFTDIQEEKIINIIQNSKKIESLEKINENSNKIEELGKLIQNLKESEKYLKESIKILTNKINNNLNDENNLNNNANNNNSHNITNNNNNNNNKINLNNNSFTNNSINNSINNTNNNKKYKKISIKSTKGENNILNDFKIKNVTSILKEYINGKISENDIFRRRKSNNSSPRGWAKKIGNESIDLKNFRPGHKKRKKHKINKKKYKIGEKIRNLSENSYEKELESDEEEKEENEEEDKEEKETITLLKDLKDDGKNNEKHYEFQKYLYRVSANENTLISRGKKKINIKLLNNNVRKEFENNPSFNYMYLSPQFYNGQKNINYNSFSNNSELENYQKNISKNIQISNNKDNIKFYSKYKNLNSINNNKSNDNGNNKPTKIGNINDTKTIVAINKNEERNDLIPFISPKRQIDKINYKINNIVSKNNNNSINFINSKINMRNNNFKLEINYDNNSKNFYKTKYDYTKLKLPISPNKIKNQKNAISNINLKLSNNDIKKLNKATSVDNLTFKSKLNEAKKIDINFNPYPENNKEKDEQKMKKIFSQMKDFLPSDEKVLLKDRFIKYGYNKEKIFINDG